MFDFGAYAYICSYTCFYQLASISAMTQSGSYHRFFTGHVPVTLVVYSSHTQHLISAAANTSSPPAATAALQERSADQ